MRLPLRKEGGYSSGIVMLMGRHNMTDKIDLTPLIELFLTEKEIALVRKNFEFLRALTDGSRRPTTEGQRHFLETVAGRASPKTEYEIAWAKYFSLMEIGDRIADLESEVQELRRQGAQQPREDARVHKESNQAGELADGRDKIYLEREREAEEKVKTLEMVVAATKAEKEKRVGALEKEVACLKQETSTFRHIEAKFKGDISRLGGVVDNLRAEIKTREEEIERHEKQASSSVILSEPLANMVVKLIDSRNPESSKVVKTIIGKIRSLHQPNVLPEENQSSWEICKACGSTSPNLCRCSE